MTRLTRMLGVRYPIILGAMRQITLAEMAAAVSNSGGFGQIASSSMSAESLQEEIQKARQLTDHLFGINIPLHRSNAFTSLEIAAKYGVKAITTSGGNPAKITMRAKGLGLFVLHKVSNTAMGHKAEAAGVDGVIATGFEAGGHGGKEQITTLCLVPQLVDALKIPVIASGGICDGRTLAAAFALGAEGVEVGTRFLASLECPAWDYYKKAILEAADNATMCLNHGAMSIRVIKNQAVKKLMDSKALKKSGAKPVDYICPHGGADISIMPAGMGAGMIHDIRSVKEIVEGMLVQAFEISATMKRIFMKETS